MSMTHYAAILPPPKYMSLYEYMNHRRHLSDRYRVHLQRKLHRTANYAAYYDGFTEAALNAALEKLKREQPVAAHSLYLEECRKFGKTPEPQGVHGYKPPPKQYRPVVITPQHDHTSKSLHSRFR